MFLFSSRIFYMFSTSIFTFLFQKVKCQLGLCLVRHMAYAVRLNKRASRCPPSVSSVWRISAMWSSPQMRRGTPNRQSIRECSPCTWTWSTRSSRTWCISTPAKLPPLFHSVCFSYLHDFCHPLFLPFSRKTYRKFFDIWEDFRTPFSFVPAVPLTSENTYNFVIRVAFFTISAYNKNVIRKH